MRREEARRFFVDKVVGQAEAQGVPLSANERKMLDWSEIEPGCVADPELAEALEAEISSEAYEARIGQLLAVAYERDVVADASAKETYRNAYSVLKQGDYYLVVLIEQALGGRLRRWWQFSTL
jgi:hypothetical protein